MLLIGVKEDLKKIHGLLRILKSLSKEYKFDLNTPIKDLAKRNS